MIIFFGLHYFREDVERRECVRPHQSFQIDDYLHAKRNLIDNSIEKTEVPLAVVLGNAVVIIY